VDIVGSDIGLKKEVITEENELIKTKKIWLRRLGSR
jgi:hypothetical protein